MLIAVHMGDIFLGYYAKGGIYMNELIIAEQEIKSKI